MIDREPGWHYGPTDSDQDPGKMWHYGCGQEVDALEGGYICGCGQQWEETVNENIEWADEGDNGHGWASGGPMMPDTRTIEEKRRDTRRFARQWFVAVWKWRLRGLLPRGWKDNEY